jgi:hypothetical protein
MGIDVDGGLASTHLMFVKRGLADKWREQGWLLKKSVFLKKVENRVIENVQATGENRL